MEKIVLAGGIIIVLMCIKSYRDDQKRKRQIRAYLQKMWGVPEKREYTDQLWKKIAIYYQEHCCEGDLDDITWNDLDMEFLYQKMNHTKTSIGEEYLYALMRKTGSSTETLQERERLITYFQEHQEERLALQEVFLSIGKTNRFSVYGQLCQMEKNIVIDRKIHIFLCVALLVCGLGCIWNPDTMIPISILLMGINIITYYMTKAEIQPYIGVYSFLLRMLSQWKRVAEMEIPILEVYQTQLRVNTQKFRKFCRYSCLVEGGGEMKGDIWDSLMDYVRMLTHVDLIKFSTMMREADKHRQAIVECYEIIGFLDCMQSIASVRAMYPVWCTPTLKSGESYIECKGIRHPLLEKPVSHDFSTRGSVLLSGSNASGKSTFLKTLAMNSILAQTLHTVMAEKYEGGCFAIASSMALRDSIANNESYYIVEIKSIKRLLDKQKDEALPVLCFIDEVLRGTNTVERIAASGSILRALAATPHLCFAATHDIELTYLLESVFTNYHFEEQIRQGQVHFDYQIKKGRACTKNAIRLLEMLAYPENVLQEAQEAVSHFLETGSWN